MKKRILGLLTALMLVLPMFPALPVAAAEVPEGTENLSGTFDGIDVHKQFYMEIYAVAFQ